MAAVYDTTAPKRAVNLNINSDLVAKARALKLNLSEAFEKQLAELVRLAQRENWQAENAEAIKRANARIEKHGLITDHTWGLPDDGGRPDDAV